MPDTTQPTPIPDANVEREIEQMVRAHAAKYGFNPDYYYAKFQRNRKNGHKMKISQWMQDVLDELHRRKWTDDVPLDYEAGGRPIYGDDREVDTCDCDFQFLVNYGGSEGIYVDWNMSYYDPNEKCQKEEYLGAFKTLEDDLSAMEKMGILAARLTWLGRNINP